jgi:hypothetical protein
VFNVLDFGAHKDGSARSPDAIRAAIQAAKAAGSGTILRASRDAVSGLRISDVIASGKVGLKAFGTSALELHNVQVNAESGPAFLVRDSKELELDHVSTRTPHADAPVIRLDNSPGAIVRSSRAFAGTGTSCQPARDN